MPLNPRPVALLVFFFRLFLGHKRGFTNSYRRHDGEKEITWVLMIAFKVVMR